MIVPGQVFYFALPAFLNRILAGTLAGP